MLINIQEICELWQIDEPKFKDLGKLVYMFICNKITECEILPTIIYRTKELLSIIKKIKKKSTQKVYSYSNLNDKLGIRIICTFQEEMDIIDRFLKKYFIIKKAEYKKSELDFNRLDYISNHYDVTIKTDINFFSKYNHYKDLIFEIQVRTLNQHAWSESAHTLSYKQEAELPSYLNRRVYRLLSLYEIADDEFSAVNQVLISNPDTPVYTLIRKLEGKIYKYAQIDYDRDISLITLKKIISWLKVEEVLQLIAGIDEFIRVNDKKIDEIFNENRLRFFEIPFLTQPEIFIIWFGLENFYFTFRDNWANDFDSFELEQISTLWGKQIC
jgi:ppGpp synthetase/RelA/SpoT-type nucleotidyltranferase